VDLTMPEGVATPADCTIVLVRHAHNGMAGRFCGHSDPPLSSEGREQAARSADSLAHRPLTHIFSSDLLRCRETAAFVVARARLPVELLPELREMRFGEWEGLTWDEITQRDAAYARRWIEEYPWLPAPGGEEFGDFRKRVQTALHELAGVIPGGHAAVVTHSGVIRTFLLDVLQLPVSELAALSVEYASCTEIHLRAGRWCTSV
jgi:alpha-ribazole phosphatase/probable phosphoglycerate mutase